jgi:electron transfer flavoprotein alpha subunit
VFVECPRGRIPRESLEALSAGLAFQKQHGMEMAVVWAGSRPEGSHLEYLGSLGVRRIICLEGVEDPNRDRENLLCLLKDLYRQHRPDHFFFGSTPLSLSLAPGLAALVDVGYVAKATYLRRVGDTLSLTRPLAQGALSESLQFLPPTRGLASLYPRAFDFPRPSKERTLEGVLLQMHRLREPGGAPGRPEIIESALEPAEALELEDAEIVVAGGRGMQSEENFALLRELACSLRGAVGASRIAVDLGWAPRERLVGQTGKKVGPELYMGFGISGAHQHQAGMKDARHILAVNTDPQAPIFRIATWGILGDAASVAREMIGRLKKADSPR